MPQARMRMRPWLELQINSNEIPGLSWINKEEKLFQIPWKHAAKHGWELEKDACLFKNWAIHTGRYKEGDVQPDPKTWKANFRCAMNSLPDIQEVKDQSISKGSSAIRVYRMLKPSVKSQRKEKKSKSLKNKSPRKSLDDIKAEETAEATNSIQLPDDHSGYVLNSYPAEEMEVGSTLGLSTCELNNSDFRNCQLEELPTIQVPDSTNDVYDIYQLQVSPITSSSDDEDNFNSPLYQQILNSSDWHQNCIGGKGFLINEAGMQNLCFDLTFQEQDTAFDSTNMEVIPLDSKPSLEFSLLESLRPTSLPPIPCGM
ncbi:interferon regulatory factor 1 isoform X2 [Python bivittatus]|uniref:Interferon regulatory factor n=1 Tax=Python bivittatus TaxID=176946 RepID=A0A9F2R742_PYTBI|nr:interferon regulatory factor 1 isoform X2 [Python bivittatus]